MQDIMGVVQENAGHVMYPVREKTDFLGLGCK